MNYRKTHDIAVKTGSYEKDGRIKNRYENVGYVLTAEDGGKMYFLNRTFNPAGVPIHEGNERTVLINVFEVKGSGGGSEPANGEPNVSDEIPFD